ncbi:DUF4181 domain-containing protein [Halobacillus salinus]|uniref:DUF4181 domain-containing protein n=1 Tax=Halobacillus salinus TaxID=192814 RepID=A0A4Z0GUB8_9BACI|nr:DUF4181 domain-containing protein [Halobacillus salinus]
MKSLIIFVLAVAYNISSNRWLTKRFNIKEKKSNYVNEAQKVIEVFIIIATLGIIFVIPSGLSSIYVVFSCLSLITIIRIFIEWKFERESKEYILSINNLIIYILIVVSIFVFIKWSF